MKRHFGFVTAAVAALFLAGCFGGGGSTAPAPTNVVATAKDGRVVVTWNTVPGVEYWVWKAAAPNVTPETCSSLPQCTTLINVSSGVAVPNLANGTTYSFSVNGRIGGGPGGPGSPAVSAIPRPAGDTWVAGSALGGSNMRGVTYGAMFVAVGDAGVSYSSTDGKNWSPLTNNVTVQNLNAVRYDAFHAKYLGVGAGGVIVALTPATSSTTWSQVVDNATINTLYALTNNGAGFTVAVGNTGTIITSSDAATWTLQTSGTTNPLYGVAYGYDNTNLRNVFVAVGANGTILYSVDGFSWTTVSPVTPPGIDLRSVTYGANAAMFVAVGTNGTVLTSPDGITWTVRSGTSILATSNLNSVTFLLARRFVAVADDGNIYYSEYASGAATWTQVTPQVTTTPLYGITTGPLLDYAAVGGSGLSLYSD